MELQLGDIVKFTNINFPTINNLFTYVVSGVENSYYLSNFYTYMGNDYIFNALGIKNKHSFVDNIIGYNSYGVGEKYSFPEVKTLSDLQKVVNALDDYFINPSFYNLIDYNIYFKYINYACPKFRIKIDEQILPNLMKYGVTTVPKQLIDDLFMYSNDEQREILNLIFVYTLPISSLKIGGKECIMFEGIICLDRPELNIDIDTPLIMEDVEDVGD